MRLCILLSLFLINTAFASELNHSMWVGPNYVDTEYSVLFETKEIRKADVKENIIKHTPFGWWPYYVKAKVIDVYKGELETGQTIDLLVYLSAPLKSDEKRLSDSFILSFCKSNGGIYYTSRNFLITRPTPDNIAKFAEVREKGTDHEGSGDCSGNYPFLNPDTHVD